MLWLNFAKHKMFHNYDWGTKNFWNLTENSPTYLASSENFKVYGHILAFKYSCRGSYQTHA